MSDQQRHPSGSRFTRIGIVADGSFKLVVAAAYAVFNAQLASALGVAPWIVSLTAMLVAASGIVEIVISGRAERRHVFLLAAYDSVWVVVSAVTLLTASLGIAESAIAWFAFQAIASIILAVLFLIARTRP